MSIVKEIYDGWKNVITDQENELSVERLSICNQCPNKIQLLGMDCCGICHCVLVAKSKSVTSECPLGKWIR